MVKWRILFSAGMIIFMGCARPNYLPTYSKNNLNEQSLSQCSIQLKEQKLCLHWYWENKIPHSMEYASLIYFFTSPDQPLVKVTPVGVPSFKVWMDSMGHGSSPATIETVSEGLYRASKVYFIMDCDWTLHFEFKDLNGQVIDEAVEHVWVEAITQ